MDPLYRLPTLILHTHQAVRGGKKTGPSAPNPFPRLPQAMMVKAWAKMALRLGWAKAPIALQYTQKDEMSSLQHIQLNIRWVGDEEGRALNRQFREKDYPTNVLSFADVLPMENGWVGEAGKVGEENGRNMLCGDIAIVPSVVFTESRTFNVAFSHRCAHLVIHGCLHVLGYDHETRSDQRNMEAIEKRAMQALGFPNPY